MKKVYMLLSALLIASITFAQINSNTKLSVDRSKLKKVVKNSPFIQAPKTVNDTVGLNDYVLVLATDQFYYNCFEMFTDGSPMGGFLSSPDIAAQSFKAEGVLFRINGISALTSSTLDSKIYLGAGYYSADTTINLLAKDSIIFSQLDTTTGWNTKLFAAPVQFPTTTRPFAMVDFSASVDAGDTIFGLVFDGDFSQLDGLLYVKVAGEWGYYFLEAPYSFYEAWIIAESSYGIVGSDTYLNGIQLSQNYPNPSVNGTTTINYALNKSFNNISIEIMDVNGKIINVINEGSKSIGTYSTQISNHLASGVYFYSLNADGYRFTKKMVIE
ncbi:MAG: T9SS type A sorting domain-containing protein [Bacteroidetes bacterium]|nr:T9SS type A sorting domain-containing protein [Bacteroidota bacterium]